MTRDEWIAGLPGLSQGERDRLLFYAVENMESDKAAELVKAGAQVNGGRDMFTWILRRNGSMEMANALLDVGMTAETVLHKDCWEFFDENKDKAYETLGRLFNAGMSDNERVKAAASALKKGDFLHLDAYIMHPGEDVTKLLGFPDFGKLPVAWNRNDMRNVAQDDVDKYIAWHKSVEDLYDAHFADGIDEKKLKEAVNAEGMTGLMLAARVGKMKDVAAFYRNHPELALDPDDLTREDKYAQSVIKLLGQRSQLQGLFAPEFWRGAPEDMLEALTEIPKMYRAQLDEVKIARDVAQERRARTAAAKHSV
jgi:hypothetical protein